MGKLSERDYRLWIDDQRESHLTDEELIQRVAEQPQTPFGIAGGTYRVSTTRIQCHYLSQLGYLNQTSADTYIITTSGESALEQPSQFNDGYVRLEEEMNLHYEHVTNLGELLDADTIIQIINNSTVQKMLITSQHRNRPKI